MSDLISRQKAIDGKIPIQLSNGVEIYDDEAVSVDYLKHLPSADVVERKKGEWIFNPNDAIELMFAKPKCSECGFESADGGNYCSNCGADMRKEVKS